MTNTIAKVVEQSIPQDLSLVAVDSNDKVLGVIINEDFTSGVSENYGKIITTHILICMKNQNLR